MKTHESQEKSVTHIQADQFGLFQNMPNPFTAQTVIAFMVPQGRNWRMCVQDAQQRAVRTFEGNEGGTLTLAWDGTDDAGVEVQTGTYFYLLESGGSTDQRKMTLIR